MTYINPREKAFGHLDRLSAWQQGDTAAPVTVEWDLMNVCSLGCQSCHFAHTHVKGPWAATAVKPDAYADTGTKASTSVVRRGLTEMAEAGVEAVVWSGGGEPTLHPWIDLIWAHARDCGLQQGLYTLGGHIVGRIPEAAKLLSWAVVSLDCPDAETYAAEKRVPASRFQDACDGIQRLVDSVPVVGVSFLLHKGNWRRTGEMVTLARTLGATYTTFRPTVEADPNDPGSLMDDATWISCALPSLRRLQDEADVEVDPDRFVQYRDWVNHGYATCHGVKLLTQVTPDGRVWICPNRRGIAGSELGNLTQESFHDIWARHPGRWTVDQGCRAFCRLHLVNETLATVYTERPHEAFI